MSDIYTRSPINKTAAIVVGSGFHYEPDKKIVTNDSDTPHQTRMPNASELGQAEFVNLTGKRVGRLTVIGIARDFRGCWVVRCDCGIWTTRSSRALKNPKNNADRCEHCRHLAYLKRKDKFMRTGKD